MMTIAIIVGELCLLLATILAWRRLEAHQSGRRRLSWYAHRRKTRRLEVECSAMMAVFSAYTLVSIVLIIMALM